jgi:hypothetical protein
MLSNASGRAEVAQDVCRVAQFHLKRIGIEVTYRLGAYGNRQPQGMPSIGKKDDVLKLPKREGRFKQ